MIRAGVILLALAITVPIAATPQDRPPDPPEALGTRPIQRPTAPSIEPESPVSSSPAPTPVLAPDPALMFGPPAPPAWWDLRETDAEFAACTRALSSLGTAYVLVPPVVDGADRDCGIARPIRVTRILPGLDLEGDAVMRCQTAQALGLWAQDFLRPAAARLPGAPRVTGLRLGTTYDCRPRVGTGTDRPKMSEHALGNAIDIAAILFDSDEGLTIQPRTDSGDLAEAFQRTIRSAGCLFFTTVLGPGSNAAHDDHLHLDLAARRGGWRICQ